LGKGKGGKGKEEELQRRVKELWRARVPASGAASSEQGTPLPQGTAPLPSPAAIAAASDALLPGLRLPDTARVDRAAFGILGSSWP